MPPLDKCLGHRVVYCKSLLSQFRSVWFPERWALSGCAVQLLSPEVLHVLLYGCSKKRNCLFPVATADCAVSCRKTGHRAPILQFLYSTPLWIELNCKPHHGHPIAAPILNFSIVAEKTVWALSGWKLI